MPKDQHRPVFDGTLHTAFTPEEQAEAEAYIDSLKTLEDIVEAAQPGRTRLCGLQKPPLPILYVENLLFQLERTEAHFAETQTTQHALAALTGELNRITKIISDRGTELNAHKEFLAWRLVHNLPLVKETLRRADLAHRHQDDLNRLATSATPPPTHPVRSPSPRPPRASPGPRERLTEHIPRGQRDLVRPLSDDERQVREKDQCFKCGDQGHWSCDHNSYFCPGCQTLAPGHTANSDFCPGLPVPSQSATIQPHHMPSTGSSQSPIYVSNSEDEDDFYDHSTRPGSDDGYPGANLED